jgi:DNA (cytosine-5)-methyltransferase 1
MAAGIPKKRGKRTRLPVIDLFSGVGGLSLGACRAGFDLALAVDNDRQAMAAHKLNFPGSKHSKTNITRLTGKSLLRLAGLKPGELVGLIGGPPCQGFSNMGHREATDPRNQLFRKFFQLVQEAKPWFFMAENVPGILDAEFEYIRAAALQIPEGYTILEPIKVTASDFGAPTTRTRVIFFGYRPDKLTRLGEKDLMPSGRATKVRVGEALKGLPARIDGRWDTDDKAWRKVGKRTKGAFWQRVFGKVPPNVGHAHSLKQLEACLVSGCIATRHEPEVRGRFSRTKPGKADPVSRAIRLNPKGYCPTLRAGTNSDRGSYQAVRPIHPSRPRVITPREAARLQGFPDWFRFDPTKWHSFRQIGNSVSPLLAEKVLAAVKVKVRAARKASAAKSAAA